MKIAMTHAFVTYQVSKGKSLCERAWGGSAGQALAKQAQRPEFDSRNPHKGENRLHKVVL